MFLPQVLHIPYADITEGNDQSFTYNANNIAIYAKGAADGFSIEFYKSNSLLGAIDIYPDDNLNLQAQYDKIIVKYNNMLAGLGTSSYNYALIILGEVCY